MDANTIDKHFQAGLEDSRRYSAALSVISLRAAAECSKFSGHPEIALQSSMARIVPELVERGMTGMVKHVRSAHGAEATHLTVSAKADLAESELFQQQVVDQIADVWRVFNNNRRREKRASPEALQATVHREMPESERTMGVLEAAGQALLNAEKQAARDAAPAQEMTTKATPTPPGVTFGNPIAKDGVLMVPGVDDRAGRGKYPAKKKRK